jgi:hypothetical protein
MGDERENEDGECDPASGRIGRFGIGVEPQNQRDIPGPPADEQFPPRGVRQDLPAAYEAYKVGLSERTCARSMSLTTRSDISKARAIPRRSSSSASSTLRDSVGSSGIRARWVRLRLYISGHKVSASHPEPAS